MSGGFVRHRRPAAAAALLFFLLAATLGARCVVVDSARSMLMEQQATRSGGGGGYARPAPAMRLYGGYLRPPKVIPPSGPSEGHNSVGPEERDDDRMRTSKQP